MREIIVYWWSAYGNFSTGVNNLPHIGDVIRYYRKLRGISHDELAVVLGWTARYIKMLESTRNKDMPGLLPRRILLAKALQIPPILLGLSSITLIGDDTIHGTNVVTTQEETIDTRALAFYEGMLALAWEFYYTSSVQRAAKQVQACFDLLNHDAQGVTGTQLDQYDAMKCRFYQLFSLVARDQMDIKQAIDESSKAVSIAQKLENAELIASSLLRRARIYLRQGDFQLAYQDTQKALPYADLSRDPLKGKVYQIAGEALGRIAGENKTLQDKSLFYFGEAGRIVRKGDLTPDGSFVKTDLTSIYIELAEALTLFGRYNDAHNALAIARKNLKPGVMRWEVNLLLEEAKTYYAQKAYDDCCISLISALKLVREVNLHSKEKRIAELYQLCKNAAPKNREVQKLGAMLGVNMLAS